MFKAIKDLKSLLDFEKVQTDNAIFRLHYKLTAWMLFMFSMVLSGKQYFGEPINCDFDGTGKKEVLNHYCWIFGTFIVKENLNNPHLPGMGLPKMQKQIEHFSMLNRESYYQWVGIIFCIQALFFYLPRYLWTNWECERMRLLVENLQGPLMKWNKEKKEEMLTYLARAGSTHNIYTIRYFFCEQLNFVNVMLQIYLTNWFVAGKFFDYGVSKAPYSHLSALNTAFPKIAKCTYYRIGSSGSEESRDALCILPLNVLNEKIFLVLWYWFFFLALLTGLGVLYRYLFVFIPRFRALLLRAFTRKLDVNKANFIVSKISFGEFFMLYKMGKNINPIMYQELVMGLYEYLLAVDRVGWKHTFDA